MSTSTQDKWAGPCQRESNVPIPYKYFALRDMYSIHTMKVGDSRYFPNSKPSTVYSLAKESQKRYPGWRFTVRKMADGMRMWRTQ